MNTRNFDSQFCGSLPLANINQVQSYGFVLVLNSDLSVLQISENAEQFLSLGLNALLGRHMKDLASPDFCESLQKKKEEGLIRFALPLKISDKLFLAIVHIKNDHVILELEPANDSRPFLDIYATVHQSAEKITRQESVEGTLAAAARVMKDISGFDKVMIYRFDRDWNGHVMAEEMEQGMASYLGLHFPASDIPKQARELYLKNPYRQIPDRTAPSHKMYPVIFPQGGGFLDMSDCNLRAVPKVHIEYLGNMNVSASMSTRILKDGQLWGLISCHHREPKFLGYEECMVFELMSGIISSKLSALELKDDVLATNKQQTMQSGIVRELFQAQSLSGGLKRSVAQIRDLLGCDGLAYVYKEKIERFDACPPADELEKIVLWLQTRKGQEVFSTDHLSDEYEEGRSIAAEASGLLAMPINPEKGEYLIGFRKEVPHGKNWGGNPSEAIQFEADRKTYHPRNSFAIWQEDVRETSLPFTKSQLFFANELQRITMARRLRDIEN